MTTTGHERGDAASGRSAGDGGHGGGPRAEPGAGSEQPAPGELSGPAPGMLSRPVVPGPLPPPLHDAAVVTTLHTSWARLAAAASEEAPTRPGAAGGGRVRAKVRAKVAAAAASTGQAQDRELIGDLIRGVDALAQRLDGIASRLHRLELTVEELFDRMSEDLVRVQAAAERGESAAPRDARAVPPPPGRDTGGGAGE